MTKRALLTLLCAAVLLLCALSTRGGLFWMLFWVLILMIVYGLVSALWTRFTLSITCNLDEAQVTRGERVNMSIDIRHMCPLPIAALRLDLFSMADGGTYVIYAPVQPFVVNGLDYGLFCPHVGAYASGISGVRVRDVFGLFSLYRKVRTDRAELIVQPQIYLAESLKFSPGDSDIESATARAFEDATMPTDLRAFQQGDELKKVHWKLSLRRNEMLVRVYEQPQRPDALLLVDCAPPDNSWGDAANVRDAICEAAASIASKALQDGAPVRLPLLNDTPVDISAGKPEEIAMISDALARCAFDGSQEFERVLMLETRRMRRTGSTAIVTSRLNPALADMVLRIRRMGPKVRLLLVADPDNEMIALLTTRLMRNDIEVETIALEKN